MSERKSLSGGDWTAIGVFFAGALVGVLMSYGLWTGVGGTSGTAALAAVIAGSIGPWPALLGGAGWALLGARAFLTGDRSGLVAGMIGVVGVAIGLSVVAGSLSAVRGGSFGAATGGRIAEIAHPAVGVLLGAIVAFGAAYFAWMREDPAAAAKLAPARRLTPAPPKAADDGVTAAESAMLVPSAKEVEEEVAPARPIATPVKPLYPEDVRLKGEVPAGTRPLVSTNALAAAPAIPAAPEPAVYRWTAPRPAPDATRIAPEEIEALADEPAPIPETVAIVEEMTDEVVEDAEAHPMPPRPTWETTGLAEDDEPVDAYGTPLSLVEKARRDRDEDAEVAAPVVAARIPREIGEEEGDAADEPYAEPELESLRARESEALGLEAPLAVEPDEDELDLVVDADEVETEVEAGDEPVAVVAEVAPEPEPVAAPRSMLEELRATNAALRAESEAEDAYDALEEEVTSAVAEAEPVAAEMEAEELEETELDEEELVEPEPVLAQVVAVEIEALDDEDELVEEEELVAELDVDVLEEELEEDVDEEMDEVVEEEVEPEPVLAVEPAPVVAPRTKVGARSLFDAVETEREHVLQPQAAVPASRAEKAPGRGIDPEKKLLVEVGCMFVERGRVAVSMLQRQYDMDFDQACRVLDDLQEMGLIGPYMGGKNRDILLTKEKWLEKVGAN